ncbi:unnamed protein product [Echinostoma caproni]|uniref:START domain-containing protein n=1 Tax=Echinostoma caproni TaxID=27848 RepID=A0A183BH42_9TREM|nr:unnamed protein product [Echinostoma caproni]
MEAKLLVKELGDMLRNGGFHLTKWFSNCPDLLSDIPSTSTQATEVDIDLQRSDQRALGVHWRVSDDSFTFELRLPASTFTKRGILSCVASLYDPLGIVAPM